MRPKLTIAVFLTIIIVVSIILIYPSIITNNTDNSMSSVSNSKQPLYHFILIGQNSDDPFWEELKTGVFKAAEDYNVAVEFNCPRFTNLQEQKQYLEIAIASKVDGIATHVLDEATFAPLINQAVEMGIPTVTVETDARNSKRMAFIGNNSYQIGYEEGQMVVSASLGKSDVALIMDSYTSDIGDVSTNLRISGFKDAVKEFGGLIDIKEIKVSGMGLFTAGEITNQLIANNPKIDTIICSSPKDTLGVAQMLVDQNKVGKINIIGYGYLPEIFKYIEKGVVYGSIISNPYNMGYNCIKALLEIKTQHRTSAYVDTGVYSVTKQNIYQYIKPNTSND